MASPSSSKLSVSPPLPDTAGSSARFHRSSPHLSAPAAIAFMRELGIEDVQRHNHTLAWDGARHLAERWGTEFVTPEALIGTMATVMLPETLGSTADDAARLRDALLFDHRIEVQVHAFRGRLYARISGQVYIEASDIERLAAAVLALSSRS